MYLVLSANDQAKVVRELTQHVHEMTSEVREQDIVKTTVNLYHFATIANVHAVISLTLPQFFSFRPGPEKTASLGYISCFTLMSAFGFRNSGNKLPICTTCASDNCIRWTIKSEILDQYKASYSVP